MRLQFIDEYGELVENETLSVNVVQMAKLVDEIPPENIKVYNHLEVNVFADKTFPLGDLISFVQRRVK